MYRGGKAMVPNDSVAIFIYNTLVLYPIKNKALFVVFK